MVFIAGEAKGEVAAKFPGGNGDVLNVFVPTTPTPLSGYLVFAKRSDVIILDMTVEDAAKLVISAGIVAPEFNSQALRSGEPIPLTEAARRIEADEGSTGSQQPDRGVAAEKVK